MLNIPALEKLVHELNRLPGVGPKTAQRLAYFILKSKESFSTQLAESIQRVQSEVHTCTECFNYTDRTVCRYCEDPHRQSEVICLVDSFNGRDPIRLIGAPSTFW